MNKFLPVKRLAIYQSVFAFKTDGRSFEIGAKGEAANLLAITTVFCLITLALIAIARS